MNIRKDIRDAMVEALASPIDGFNARLAAVAGEYGIQPFDFDFGSDSYNFLQAFYGVPEDVELSAIRQWPAMALYTTNATRNGLQKGVGFSGAVQAHVDIYLRYRLRDESVTDMETRDTESIADAVEDALLSVFQRRGLAWPTGCTYNGEINCDRDPVVLYGDGYLQRLPTQLRFEVNR